MRAVRSAERISGVRDAGELLILGMEIVGCGAIFRMQGILSEVDNNRW